MKVSAAFKSMIPLMLLVVVGILSACGPSTITTPDTTTSVSLSPPDMVEVDYFYEGNSCVCLALAHQWIDTTISTNYPAQLASGKLVYNSYDSQNTANATVMQQFNAPLVSFFITTVRGTVRSTEQITKLWLYTDPSQKNEMLHTMFVGVLTSALNNALAGS